MSTIELGVLLIMIYIGVYSIIDRICRCIESCAILKHKSSASADKVQIEKVRC